MPLRPYRPCKHSGCPELTRNKNGYCDNHQQDHADKLKRWDRSRGTANERGYTYRWQQVRESYLRQCPLCEMCLMHGKTVPATVVHHKVPIVDGGPRLDTNNFMALCRDCHEEIHGRK